MHASVGQTSTSIRSDLDPVAVAAVTTTDNLGMRAQPAVQADSLRVGFFGLESLYGPRESYYFLVHVVGEKCSFDRLPDAMFTRGLRHADTPVELYHRADVAELLSRDSLTQSARRQKKLVLQDLAVELQQTKQALADLAAASCEATEEAPCRASTIRLASW